MMRTTQQRPGIGRASYVAGALALLASITLVPAAGAQQTSEEWLERCRRSDSRRAVHCEVRETRLPATGSLDLNARPNGGIQVEGWDRNEVLVRARVQAQAPTEAEAREIASVVRVEAGNGRVRSEGPRTDRSDRDRADNRGWSVSYEVFVPRRTDLAMESTNGGIRVQDVQGRLEATTTNGGISLDGVSGDVRGRTTNGGLDVRVARAGWTGAGLDLRTTNGGIDLRLPDGVSARLEAETVNGGISTDFPITVQGRIGRRIEADLGGGGPPIRLSTTNGRVSIRRN
jgi:hypothetical protein